MKYPARIEKMTAEMPNMKLIYADIENAVIFLPNKERS